MADFSPELKNQLAKTPRFNYPEDEARYPWLSVLLDAYHLTDAGIDVELAEEIKRRNRQPGCHRGCYICCLKANVPISPLEKAGIDWFVTEKLTGDARYILEEQLEYGDVIPHCPFIVDSVCSIYPMRPLGCRIFFVFGTPCETPGSIATERKDDIWSHSRELARHVAMTMLPYYGITEESDKEFAFASGFIFSKMIYLRSLDWKQVAAKMREIDKIRDRL